MNLYVLSETVSVAGIYAWVGNLHRSYIVTANPIETLQSELMCMRVDYISWTLKYNIDNKTPPSYFYDFFPSLLWL